MTRSGGYSDQSRAQQLEKDKVKREAEAANRRLHKLYALADKSPVAGPSGLQRPARPSPPPLRHSPSDDSDEEHQYYDPAGADTAASGGDGGDGGGGQGPPTSGNMPPKYDETTGKDAEDLFQKVGNIKLAWPDDDDIQFWIQQLETKMRFAGVKSQFLKLQVITNVLPAKFMPPIKSMLKVMDDEADETCYKRVKTRLLECFGKKEEEEVKLAYQMVLTTTPSQLARDILDKVCDGNPQLQGCHCAKTVTWMWWEKLPQQIRQAVANMSLKTDFEATLKAADASHRASQTPTVAPLGVEGATAATPPELAAFGTGQAKGQNSNQGAAPGGAGRGRGTRKPKSADNPPKRVCKTHYDHGESAYNCLDPFQCPMAQVIVQRPTKNKGKNANTQQGNNS